MTTNEKDTSSTESSPATKKYYKVSDELIGMIRELVQLALLTGTNIVDHMRTLVVEESSTDGRFVTVSPEYIEAYNKMVENLNEEAEKRIAEMQKRLVEESAETPTLDLLLNKPSSN